MNGELYPGEFEAMERQGRLDAVIPEQKMMTNKEAIEWFMSNPFYHIDHKPFNTAIKALDKCDKIEKIINSDDNDFIANYVRGLFAE